MKELSLEEVAKLLGAKTEKYARKWLTDNDVFIYHIGEKHFVYQLEFDQAYDRPLMENLKAKYGHRWKVAYETYKGVKIPILEELNTTPVTTKAFESKNELVIDLKQKFSNYAKQTKSTRK